MLVADVKLVWNALSERMVGRQLH